MGETTVFVNTEEGGFRQDFEKRFSSMSEKAVFVKSLKDGFRHKCERRFSS